MQPKRYSVERDGKFTTVMAMSRCMAAVAVYPDLRPISWVEHKDYTVVNKVVTVREVI
jgi:hypothetical protein